MDIGVVSQVAKPVLSYCFGQVGQGLSQIQRYKENIKELFYQRSRLKCRMLEIEKIMGAADAQGQDIVSKITEWLDHGTKILQDADRAFPQADERTYSTDETIRDRDRCCFGLLHWNLKYRYTTSKKAEDMSTRIKKQLEEVVHVGSGEVGLPSAPQPLGSISSGFSKTLASRERLLKTILEALKDKKVNMIGVFGMGGVGKNTLVEEVARRAEADKIFYKVVIAEVSETPDIIKIQEQIAEGIGSSLKHLISVDERARELNHRLQRLSLKGRKEGYRKFGAQVRKVLNLDGKKQDDDQGPPENRMGLLVILKNLWTKLDLLTVGIPYGHKANDVHCQLVLTTRSENICEEMGVDTKFKVAVLDRTEARALLLEKAAKVPHDQESFKLVIDELVEKCGGLPLAINVLADKLRSPDLSVWKRVAAELGNLVFSRDGVMEEKVYPILGTSYNFLSSSEKKKFFMLCCLSRPGSSVAIQDLVRYGVGLGLFRHMNSLAEATQQAVSWAIELKSSSLLLEAEDEGHVKIHDFVRAASLHIAARGGLVFQVGSIPRLTTEETFESCTAISMMSDENLQPLRQFGFSKLEMLLLKGGHSSWFGQISNRPMKSLKVLVLSYMKSLELPSSITSLKMLGTLYLEHCELKDISVICELANLSILSLRESTIEELPERFGELLNLMLLDLTGCSRLQIIPAGVLATLTGLEELYANKSFENWDITRAGHHDKGNMASLIELNSLARLKVLEMHIPSIHDLPGDLNLLSCSSFKISIGYKGHLEESKWGSYSRILSLGYMDDAVDPRVRLSSGLLAQTECLILRKMESLRSAYDWGKDGFRKLKSIYVEGWYDSEYIKTTDERVKKDALPESSPLMNELKAVRNVPRTYYDILNALKKDHSLHLVNFRSLWDDDSQTNQYFFDEKMEFPLLEDLTISGVAGIEELWHLPEVEDDPPALAALARVSLNSLPNLRLIWWKDTTHRVRHSFRNLRTLEVRHCPSLEILCPLSVAVALEQLESIEIQWNNTMKAIVEEETGHGENSHTKKTIIFPKLQTLILNDLFCLRCFFRGSIKLNFLSLEKIVWTGSNNVITFVNSEHPIEEQDKGNDSLALFDNKVSLPAIKHIEIKSKLLQQVWGSHLLTESFGQLETFQIYGAQKEKTILPIAAAQRMKKVEELFVGDFSSVETFFDCEVPPSDEFSCELLLPQLRKLEIDTLPMLKCIPWRVLNIKNLRFLSISGVSSLTCLFPVSMSSGFKQLEKLDIKNCETLREIFGGDKRASYTTEGGVAIPRLWSLQLEDLPQLSSFSSENCVIKLPCLEVVKFTHCPMFGVFERMKHGKELTRIECTLSKRMYKGEPCDRPEVLPQTRSISWAKLSAPHLHFLSISGANGLKSLFSTSECEEFVRLEKIRIIECEDLEVIVSNEEKDGDMAPAKALFPRLRKIKLSKLENLGCFISGEYAREFPSLEVVKIDGCPNMEKFSFAPLRTPKLRKMRIGRAEEVPNRGLNATIFNLFNKEIGSRLNEQLKVKELECIDEVWHSPQAGGRSADAIFLKLSDLTLERLPHLKHVWRKKVDGDGHLFGNLVKLSIGRCVSLESLCPLSIAADLVQLKYLNFFNNESLKEIIAKQTEMTNDREMEIFPRLQTLELIRLKRLECFFKGRLRLKLPSLETINWVNNDKMITFVDAETNKGDNCSHALFNDKVALPAVKEITIVQKGLEEVWSSDLADGSFMKLRVLRVTFARKATRVFSDRALQRMNNLKELEAVAFDSAEKFLDHIDVPRGLLSQLRSLKLHFLPLLKCIPWEVVDLQNLRFLSIARADRLTSLFSGSAWFSLVLLEEIYVESCKNMEEIVAKEPEEKGTGAPDDGGEFPRLNTIELGELPKLRRFSSLQKTLKFPNLRCVKLKGCPGIKEFSTGLHLAPRLTTASIEDTDEAINEDLNVTLSLRAAALARCRWGKLKGSCGVPQN